MILTTTTTTIIPIIIHSLLRVVWHLHYFTTEFWFFCRYVCFIDSFMILILIWLVSMWWWQFCLLITSHTRTYSMISIDLYNNYLLPDIILCFYFCIALALYLSDYCFFFSSFFFSWNKNQIVSGLFYEHLPRLETDWQPGTTRKILKKDRYQLSGTVAAEHHQSRIHFNFTLLDLRTLWVLIRSLWCGLRLLGTAQKNVTPPLVPNMHGIAGDGVSDKHLDGRQASWSTR